MGMSSSSDISRLYGKRNVYFFAVLLATLILNEKLTVSKIFLIGMLCIGVGLVKADL